MWIDFKPHAYGILLYPAEQAYGREKKETIVINRMIDIGRVQSLKHLIKVAMTTSLWKEKNQNIQKSAHLLQRLYHASDDWLWAFL